MKSHRLGAVSACVLAIATQSAQAVPVSGQGSWETTLQGRDLDGNPATFEAYYDTVLDITWLADANLAASNSFGLAYDTDLGTFQSGDPSSMTGYINSNGSMSWTGTRFWFEAMNNSGYLGYNNWRLPTMIDTGAPGCEAIVFSGTDCGYNVLTVDTSGAVYSEMATLFYNTLGNDASRREDGSIRNGNRLTNTGPFANLLPDYYWSEMEDQSDPLFNAWYLRFRSGLQFPGYKANQFYALAVRDGDVSAVPVPAAVWLFGSGLLGLVGIARRKTQPLPA